MNPGMTVEGLLEAIDSLQGELVNLREEVERLTYYLEQSEHDRQCLQLELDSIRARRNYEQK